MHAPVTKYALIQEMPPVMRRSATPGEVEFETYRLHLHASGTALVRRRAVSVGKKENNSYSEIVAERDVRVVDWLQSVGISMCQHTHEVTRGASWVSGLAADFGFQKVAGGSATWREKTSTVWMLRVVSVRLRSERAKALAIGSIQSHNHA